MIMIIKIMIMNIMIIIIMIMNIMMIMMMTTCRRDSSGAGEILFRGRGTCMGYLNNRFSYFDTWAISKTIDALV